MEVSLGTSVDDVPGSSSPPELATTNITSGRRNAPDAEYLKNDVEDFISVDTG